MRHLRQLQPQCQAMVLTAYGNLHEVEDLARPAYLFLALDSTC